MKSDIKMDSILKEHIVKCSPNLIIAYRKGLLQTKQSRERGEITSTQATAEIS
jgi:hypothetical protein